MQPINAPPPLQLNPAGSSPLRPELSACYTCGSCLAECPVNRFTSMLRPRSIVRLYLFEGVEQLLRSREIWYCLQCNRCSVACPMDVKPAKLIAELRDQAMRRGFVSSDLPGMISPLKKQLHRVRLNLAKECLKSKDPDCFSEYEWELMAGAPDHAPEHPVEFSGALRRMSSSYLGFSTNFSVCLTCGECLNVCPASFERSVFDLTWIFRMIAFGVRDELLHSPSIWLCLGCGSCSAACRQFVRGHMVLNRLQELASQNGYVDSAFGERWRVAQAQAYSGFVNKVSRVLEL